MKIRINLQNSYSAVYDDVREIRSLVNTYQTKITYRDTVAFEYEEPILKTLIWYIENHDIKSI